MKEDRPILAYAARMHEEGRRFLLTEMKKAGLDELTTSCGDIFQVLFQQEGLSLTAVAQKIRRTKSTTCVMLDRLAKQGSMARLFFTTCAAARRHHGGGWGAAVELKKKPQTVQLTRKET